MARQLEVANVTKTGDLEVEITSSFAVPRPVLFAALTQAEQLKQWMSAGGMSLTDVQQDARAGGAFRYVFQRVNGPKIEVRGTYSSFDPPRGFSYLESYDFSPLRMEVTTALEEIAGDTRFHQRLRYFSTRERDEDFEGVASSTREAFAKLVSFLERRPQ